MRRKGNKNFFKPEKRRRKKDSKDNKRNNAEVDFHVHQNKKGLNKENDLKEIEESRIVGTYVKNANFGFVMPDSRKIRTDIYVSKKNNLRAQNNQKVIVEITKQATNVKKPEGKIIEIIGNVNQAGIDMLSLIREYELPYEFPKEVEREVNLIPDEISIEDLENRVDLRNKEIFTIDGEDAKDLDDAVSVEKSKDGIYTLNVHIADVSHYVKEGSNINKEAILRGTSIYMLDRVIPMLPKELSNGICSLNAGKDRLALSISMQINKEGRVTSSKIYKSVINVTRRMSYNEIYDLLTDNVVGVACYATRVA